MGHARHLRCPLLVRRASNPLFPRPPSLVNRSLLSGQVVTIIISEYGIPYPAITRSLLSAFGWCNLSVFALVKTGCKVCAFPVGLRAQHCSEKDWL
jgi:hypothetical protein